MMHEIILCTFHNLKSLKLSTHFCQQPHIMLTLCLLKSVPNLEKLTIEVIMTVPIHIFISRSFEGHFVASD